MNLNIENITFSYGETHFQYDLSLKHPITGIFGYSGAGKTTLMNLICGIETPKTGRIHCKEKTYFDSDKHINIPVNKRNIGIVFQDKFIFPHMSVRKNLEFGRSVVKNRDWRLDRDSIVDLLDLRKLVGKRPYQLSGGERQRVAIGRCLLSEPDLLLMDEPFANLDRKRKDEIISYLINITKEFNIPLLIISHDLEDLLKLTRYLVIIENGSVKAAGDYTDLNSQATLKNLPLRTITIDTDNLMKKIG